MKNTFPTFAVEDALMATDTQDTLYGFMFNESLVRGVYVHVQDSVKTYRDTSRYPHAVADLLTQMQTACAILCANIKLEGRLSLQLRGKDGLLNYALVECSITKPHLTQSKSTPPFIFKGMAKQVAYVNNPLWDRQHNLRTLMGKEGRLIMTIEPKEGQRYQGIVALEYDNLSACLSAYFTQSEQLTTHFYLVNDARQGAGFMLQRLPLPENYVNTDQTYKDQADNDWQEIYILANSLKQDELLNLPVKQILHRLYHEYDKQLFAPSAISYQCDCSRERCGKAIVSLGSEEVDNILADQPTIVIDCQFCQARYSFDTVDCKLLLAFNTSGIQSNQLH